MPVTFMLLIAFFAEVSTIVIVSLPTNAATWAAWALLTHVMAAPIARIAIVFMLTSLLKMTSDQGRWWRYERDTKKDASGWERLVRSWRWRLRTATAPEEPQTAAPE